MTIYHHLPNKEAIIDGMVDVVFGEIDLPPTEADWRSATVHRSTGGEAMATLSEEMTEAMPADAYPYLSELATGHVSRPGYDFAHEFDYGLALILDGLDAAVDQDAT